jgi:hypothetical protein
MSEHHQENGVIKSFTLTALLAFATIFCFFVLFSTCNGPYKKVGEAGKDRLAMLHSAASIIK